MPVDGDEGQIQGSLIEEMSQQLKALEEELTQVNRLLLNFVGTSEKTP